MKIGIFLGNLGNPAIYYPTLGKITGGVAASIFMCQLLQWQTQQSKSGEWVKTNSSEIEKATGLNYEEQELAIRLLKVRSLLKAKSTNPNTDTLELWADIDAFEEKFNNLLTPTSGDSITQTSRENNYLPVQTFAESSSSERAVKTDKFFGQPRQQIAVAVNPNYRFSGPWNSQEELHNFQRALEEYARQHNLWFGNPSGWAFKIIDSMTKGLTSTFWDEFIAGIPLGESQKVKREWEIEPEVPYPAFEEERIQYYVHKGEPLEAAVSKARADLRNPVLGKDLWEGFLRKCDRIADDALKAKNQGVETAYLPSSFNERPQITKESVMNKLGAIAPQFALNQSTSETIAEPPKLEQQQPPTTDEIPSISFLQKAYQTSLGRTIVEKQIAANPEWGYEIVDGEIVESIPF
ncbi:MAG: hypothetical protein JGK21_08190 [Microcoleus sp. PH2017_22_RUC_O_B]|uniref:hypothetical protein n=1 Tax=unclassified Microcoleus TaxID=2642155 RepID=UPI001D46F2C6|nr:MULTISPECIES: hypothetical protein [unclassified Microcoleus]MCC3526996.1 hypothetical protein [Microcoleus sp. PH2017_21_RUC_O_A]MCC3540355.1 hypothetical protein [Microcoleus sp. PH2017_22_RUC_O_B]